MTTFQVKDDLLTILVHLGYLTYDRGRSEVFIPNLEISQEFLRAINVSGWSGLIQALEQSETLLKDTWKMNNKAVSAEISAIHDQTASMTCIGKRA